jgi:phosphodiesterase/alkaline phosphatase D-like protein
MGRPAKVNAPTVGTSRRGFFKASGTAVAAFATTPMLSFAGDRSMSSPAFQHGVASGDPLADRVILWTRVTPTVAAKANEGIQVRYVVATDPRLKRVVLRGRTATHASRDFTVNVDAIGLRPDTTYYYRFAFEDAKSPIGRTKTLPVGRTSRLRMAVVICSNTQTGAFLDPARQLLGTTQEAWLFDKLRNGTAKWKMLGQGVMFAQLKVPGYGLPNAQGGGLFLNSDQWDGYQPARDRIFDVIKGAGGQAPIDNLVILTGDIHSSWAADLTQDPNNPDPATGGYDAATGNGSHAVEFVGTSVSSPGIDTDTTGQIAGALRSANPHFKYVNLVQRGYMLLDVTPDRAMAEWWHLDTVASPSNIETLATAFETRHGENRLRPAVQSTPRLNPPSLAPDLPIGEGEVD